MLRLLERFSLPQLTGAVEYALDIDVIDPDSIRTIVEHRAEQPVALFSLDGRPHLAQPSGRRQDSEWPSIGMAVPP